MGYEPDEDGWTASGWLGADTDAMYNEYLDYWELQNVPSDSELTDAHRAHFRSLKDLAESLTPCLHSLSMTPAAVERVKACLQQLGASKAAADLSADGAARIARAIYSDQIVRDGIQIDLAFQACNTLLAGAEQRAAVLIELVGNHSLSPRAAAFLDRATRLYLWGFEPESVVMCASVLEAAYEERFSDQEMFRLQIRKTDSQFKPYQYEQAAVAAKVFSLADKKLATKIRQARNDTLHNAPNIALKADEVLRSTASLLTTIFPA
jgi:hypothetical protein